MERRISPQLLWAAEYFLSIAIDASGLNPTSVRGNIQKSSSSKATVLMASGTYAQYVSTTNRQERRRRLFSSIPLWIASVSELRTRQPVQANTTFRCFNSETTVNFWWNSYHKLSTERARSQWIGNRFSILLHICDNLGYDRPYSTKGSFL